MLKKTLRSLTRFLVLLKVVKEKYDICLQEADWEMSVNPPNSDGGKTLFYCLDSLDNSIILAEPQSSEVQASSDFTPGVKEVTKGTTQFFEADTTIIGNPSASATLTSSYVEALVGIKDFLAKPQLVYSHSWSTGSPLDSNLFNYPIASALSNDIFASKIKGFNLIKADAVITVELNASPFQQGKLILYYLPCLAQFLSVNPNYLNLVNKAMLQKVQHPHVELDCRTTSSSLRVPYVAPSHFYSIDKGLYDWGTVYLDVFSALLTGPSASPSGASVDFLVYVHFENVELAAPILPQSSNAQRTRVVPETAENSGPIASGLKKVGKIANILKQIPVISEIASGVEWAADIASGVAGVLGWSKPRELRGVTVVSDQLCRYAGTADGPDLAIPGGIITNNRLERINYASYTDQDEMSLKYLLSIPFFAGEVNWAYNSGQGTTLFSTLISPALFAGAVSTDSVGTTPSMITVGWKLNSTYSYLSQIYSYWRGSFVITLKFVKTQMHSGRIQVTFTPTTATSPTTPTIFNAEYSLRAIVDIRVEDEISFVIPYLVYSDYLSTYPDAAQFLEYVSGALNIEVLNDLKAPESCSQNINIQIFFRGGEDLEFAVPSEFQFGAVPYVPQSNDTERIMHAQVPGLSMAETVIGGIPMNPEQLMHAKRCIGEKVMSIKQLLLRNMPVSGYDSTFSIGGTSGYIVDPQYISCCTLDSTSGTVFVPRWAGDLFSFLAPMYAFRRGGTRWMHQESVGSHNSRMFTCVIPSNAVGGVVPLGGRQPVNLLTTLGGFVNNLALVNNNSIAPSGVSGNLTWPAEPMNSITADRFTYNHIPFYNRFPIALNTYYDSSSTPSSDDSYPDAYLAVRDAETIQQPSVQRSISDDFQLLFFLCALPTVVSYTVS